MQQQIDRFLDYLKNDRDCSDNTIAAYRNDITQFHQFVVDYRRPDRSSITSWDEVDIVVYQNYLLDLREREYASSTIARKVAAVKSFTQYLYSAGVIADNSATKLDSPKVKKSLPRSIGPEEIERLLVEPGKSNAPKELRDKALMEVLYATGMRVTELVSLNVDDVHLSNSTVECGEGDKRRRTVPIYENATEALDRYLVDGRPRLAVDGEEAALFLNHRGQRLTRQGLWLIIKHYVKVVGIEGTVTPHTLRHSFATHMLNAGAGLREVQERLGHANLSTTQVYRQVSDDSVSELTVDGQPVSAEEVPKTD